MSKEDSRFPPRPRLVVGVALFGISVAIVLGFAVHLVWSELNVAAAEDRLRDEGVELSADFDYMGPVKVGRRVEDQMRATWKFHGVTYEELFECYECRGPETIPVWVDPDDPRQWTTEFASTASAANVPANAVLMLSSLVAVGTAIGVGVSWRYWLSRPGPPPRPWRR